MKNIFLFSIVLLLLALPASAQNIVSIGNFSVDKNAEIRVPIYLNDSTNVSDAQIRLDYNPTVVSVYSDQTLDIDTFIPQKFPYAADNSNNASGWIYISASTMGELNGNQIIGYLRLKAVGNSGSSSPLNLILRSLTDVGGDDVSPTSVTNGRFDIKSSALKYIVISPSPTTTVTDGGNQLFTATALDQDSIPMAGINISWTVTNSSVGNVNPSNAITNVTGGVISTFSAFAAGTTIVNATNGSASNTTFVIVNPQAPYLATLSISPKVSILNIGGGMIQTFNATAHDQNNNPMPGINITWSSSNASVGNVIPIYSLTGDDGNASATFTATAAGNAIVNVSNASLKDSATVTVNQVPPNLTWIKVSPPTSTLIAGGTQEFNATALDQNNIPMAGINISWTVSNSTVGSVAPLNAITGVDGNASITFTAAVTGTARVNATNRSVNGSATVTVNPPTGITVVLPNGGEIWTRGTTQAISWTYSGTPGSNVRIELMKSEVLNRTINSGVPIGSNGSGSYSWLISSTQVQASDYKVRITSTTNSTYNDTSNNNFTILAIPAGYSYIYGKVINNSVGIAGALVITNASFSTTTDTSGFYSMLVPAGKYNLTTTKEPAYYKNSSVVVTAISDTTVMKDIMVNRKLTGTISGMVQRG